ncbi:MAG: uroporphyrinogen-III C-methyltransferase [Actinomycetota bacterium]
MKPVPYVLSWRLAGRKVVVVGGGTIGTAKVELLLATGARIVVVDPHPSDRVVDLASRSDVEVRRRMARPWDLVGARLLVAATGCSDTNRRLRRWAHLAGAVVNAVDDQANCDVTVPSIIRRGPATIAITTDGAIPAGARFLREEVTAAVDDGLPSEMGDVLTHAAVARSELRSSGRYRYDYHQWRHRYFEPALALFRGATDVDRTASLDELRRRFTAEFETSTTPARPGRVVLVGAGPGGPDLITLRGARALGRCDVVIYDRLADPALLDLAPPAAERIPVGKARGSGPSQEDIQRLMLERARTGATVVRLKGGDAFVFGRGAEEVESLMAAGIEVEVVPGVSSAVAAPALAGIPVTDRRRASSFTVLTGHRRPGIDGADNDPDMEAAAQATGSIVVLMAATTAAEVARRLRDGGRPADEPVAFVHAAGTPAQAVAYSSLGATVETGCPFPSPTVMVVGAVAAAGHSSGIGQPAPPFEMSGSIESSDASSISSAVASALAARLPILSPSSSSSD